MKPKRFAYRWVAKLMLEAIEVMEATGPGLSKEELDEIYRLQGTFAAAGAIEDDPAVLEHTSGDGKAAPLVATSFPFEGPGFGFSCWLCKSTSIAYATADERDAAAGLHSRTHGAK
jgi:hypothetical protein